jgi:hypothetical protein
MKTTLAVRLLILGALAAAPVRAATQDTEADRLLRRHVDALGGDEALTRITSRHGEGTLERHGRAVPLVTYARSPNLLRIETRFPKPGTLVQGFDGTTAWVLHPLQGLRRLDARETAVFASQTWIHPTAHVAETYPVRRWLGTEVQGGVEMAMLAVGRDESRLETWRFDAATARLLQIERTSDMGPHGEVPVVVRFEDYRTVDGVSVPYVVRTRLPQGETILRLETVRHNVVLDGALFAVPDERGAR